MGVKGILLPKPPARPIRPIGERIRSVRSDILKLSQAQLAIRLEVSQSNLSKWEAGKLKPEPEYLMRLSHLLHGHVESLEFLEAAGVPRGFLEGDSRFEGAALPTEGWSMNASESSAKFLFAPLLRDPVAAGTPRAMDPKEVETMLAIPRTLAPRGSALICFRVSGESMSPTLEDGYIVVVDTAQRDPKKLVQRMVAARDQEGGVTVKWLREAGGMYLLVPQKTSPRFEVSMVSEESGWGIIGAVIHWMGFPPPVRKRD
jgi:transcriptional regulator with XRE-family HTH domain